MSRASGTPTLPGLDLDQVARLRRWLDEGVDILKALGEARRPGRRAAPAGAWSGSFPAGNTHGRGRRPTCLVTGRPDFHTHPPSGPGGP
jgi:hypothetical protein